MSHQEPPTEPDPRKGEAPERADERRHEGDAPPRATPSEEDKRDGLLTDRPPQQEPGGDVPPPS